MCVGGREIGREAGWRQQALPSAVTAATWLRSMADSSVGERAWQIRHTPTNSTRTSRSATVARGKCGTFVSACGEWAAGAPASNDAE